MRNKGWMLAGLAAAVGIGMTVAAQAAVLIEVDKTSQQMTVSVDGQTVFMFPVSTGRGNGYDTPSGKYQAFRMEKDHYSKEWDDAPMPNSIFFTKIGHAIHGSLHVNSIGNPASHGCVRLQPANAEKLFELVRKEGVLKTTVVIKGDVMVAERRAAERRALAKANGTTTAARAPALPPGQFAGQPQVQEQEYVGDPRYRDTQYQRRYSSGYDRGYVSGNADAYRSGYGDAPAYGQQRPVYADGYAQRGYAQQDPYQNGYAPPPRRGFFIFGN